MATVQDTFEELEDEYSPDEERPLGSYTAIVAVHMGVLGAALAVAARRGRLPERLGAADLAVGGVATYKLSRLLARSSVASPLRAPFTTYEGVQGPAELKEEVRGSGLRHAIGELVTCPFCLAHWIASAFALGLAFAPRVTRTLASILCVEAAADVLQRADARWGD